MAISRKKGLKGRPVKIALYSEMPFWVLVISGADCLELQRKDKKSERRTSIS